MFEVLHLSAAAFSSMRCYLTSSSMLNLGNWCSTKQIGYPHKWNMDLILWYSHHVKFVPQSSYVFATLLHSNKLTPKQTGFKTTFFLEEEMYRWACKISFDKSLQCNFKSLWLWCIARNWFLLSTVILCPVILFKGCWDNRWIIEIQY